MISGRLWRHLAMSTPLVLRIVAASHSIANKTGEIIRNILKAGDLGIVDKAKENGQKVGCFVSMYCMPVILHTHIAKSLCCI